MRIRHLLFCFTFLLLSKLTPAQWMKPADPSLLQRLKKYAADNHLPSPGIYVYWDSIAKKPVRFNTKDFTVEELSKPVSPKATTSANSRVLRDVVNFHLVKDINTLTDANPSNPADFGLTTSYAVVNNVSYFSADDGIHGTELWRSDGTAAGTYIVKDIMPGTSGSWPSEIIVSNNDLYFLAYTPTSPSYTLWKSDGTDAGTVEVAEFVGSWLFQPSYLCDVDGVVYFTATHSRFNDQLWKTDGTPQGTVLVKDLSTEDGGNNLRSFVPSGGLLYFVANTTSKGDELWRSDGTAAGTFMLKDINTDNYAYHGPTHLTSYNTHLYFSENDTDNIIKLWQTDGTPEGTVLAEGYDSNIHLVDNYMGYYINIPFVISNNNLYFSASTTATGEELYKYNPVLGAVLIKDLNPGTDGAVYNSDHITDVNGTVYFISGGTRLYKTDGTADATILLKEFTSFTSITHMTSGNGRLYFVRENDTYSYEPWTSDGTPEGTVMLKDIYAATEDGQTTSFTACNGRVLFSATDNVHGNELWTTDGIT
jgi:ELWxxDGT repeat protein